MSDDPWDSYEIVRRIMDVALPKGGGVMAFAELYLDETGTSHKRAVFAVAGCVFRKDAAIEQAAEWRLMLRKWGLPYFHMVDCAHNAGVFAHLSKYECDEAAREAIQIIRATASAYIRASVEISHLSISRMRPLWTDPYVRCAMSIPPAIVSFCHRNPDVSKIHFFFEDGATGKTKMKNVLSDMLSMEELAAECRYEGMSFVKKSASPGVQAAHMIAWHVGKDASRSFDGHPIRRDFEALVAGIPCHGGHLTREMLETMEADAMMVAAELGLTPEIIAELHRL